MRYSYHFILISFLALQSMNAQSFLGVATFGGSSGDVVTSVDIDNNGNVYTTGYFAQIVDFDPDTGVYYDTANSFNIFMEKFDASGNLLWVKSFGDGAADQGMSIVTDDSGNVYLGAIVQGTVDLDPDTGVYMPPGYGGIDFIIVKFDSTGRFIWGNRIGGGAADWVTEIDVDDSGNVYATGRFSDTVDFDPGPGIDLEYVVVTNCNSFALKLNVDGSFAWCHSFGSYYNDYGEAVHVAPDGSILFGGAFDVSVDFDPGPGTDIRTSVDGSDAYLLKLDPAGNFIWVQNYGEQVESITTSLSGQIHITGSFQFTVDFDPGAGVENRASQGLLDWYILKLTSSGTFIWVQTFGDNSMTYDVGHCIKVDQADNVIVCGHFGGTVDFDPGGGNATHVANDDDAFLMSLDQYGSFNWANIITGTWTQQALSFALDTSGLLYEVGWWMKITDFDPGVGTHLDTAVGNSDDAFIWKGFNCTVPTYGNLTVQSCQPYISPAGNTINNSGTYVETMQNAYGCDSVITLYVTIIPSVPAYLGVDTLLCYGDSLHLGTINSFDQYLWSGPSVNDTTATIIVQPLANSQYTLVTVDSNGCTDTDAIIILVDSVPVISASFSFQAAGLVDFTSNNTSVGSSTYVWNFGDSNTDNTANPTHQYNSNGTYSVTLIVVNSCGSDTTHLIVIVTGVGMEETSVASLISLYPSPANDILIVSLSGSLQADHFIITGLDGRIVKQFNFDQHNCDPFELSVAELPAGAYFISVYGSQGLHLVCPFVKN